LGLAFCVPHDFFYEVLLIRRRDFLLTTGKAMIAAPALASTHSFGLDQRSPTKTKQTGVPERVAPKLSLNIRDLGVTGDGKTKDTDAIRMTIERCSVLGGGEVVVPAGEYLTGAIALRSNVTLRLEKDALLRGSPDMADYPLSQVRWEGRWIKGYLGLISAMDAENIAIVGTGKIVASEAIKGRVERPSGRRLPALLEFINCRRVVVQDVYTEQTGMWSIHPTLCSDVTFRNLVIKSGADGIDVDSCQRVVIDGCDFETSDDCISLKSGRGEEAASQIGSNPQIVCEDILIRNCSFVDQNFACIGIGSEVSGGIRNARIEGCKFKGAKSHAVYIKSRVGRGAFIEDISVTDCDVSGVQQGFLRIVNLKSGRSDEFDVPGPEGITRYRNFRFSNIRVVDVPQLVEAVEIHPDKPLDGLVLSNISGTCKKGIEIANAKNVSLSGITVTGYEGPLVAINNVTGKGLAGAATIEAPKIPDQIPVTTPYQLH
jgi:polygalacturonase